MASSVGIAQEESLSGTGRPLDWSDIQAYLSEVGEELAIRGLSRSVAIVGGAYVASRGVRSSTTDVDTIDELDSDFKDVIAAIAERHGLESDWLNDRARPWRPATFEKDLCQAILRVGGLVVLAPHPDTIVLMKIAAGGRTPNDARDLKALWSASNFTEPAHAAEAFYAAYPHEEIDPHLAAWIRSVIT